MNAIYFDADKWHQKLLEEEKFFDELTALAYDTHAATSHLDDEIDIADSFTKNYLWAGTIERLQSGISTTPVNGSNYHGRERFRNRSQQRERF